MKYRNLSHSLDVIYRRMYMLFGRRNLLSAVWWGVQLGRYSRFYGKCYFKRYPGSKISIGDHAEFLSTANSNLLGINRPCLISTLTAEAVLEIGNNCGLSGTVIGAFKSIRLGDNVRCGANTLITDSDWHPDDPRSGPSSPVSIGNNVWLGGNAIILKGVSIGDNTVIGAGSIVTRDIPADVIAAGNPCRVIRPLKM